MTILTNLSPTAWRGAKFAPVEIAAMALGGGRMPMAAFDFTVRDWRIAGRNVTDPLGNARLDLPVVEGGERGLVLEPAGTNRIFPSAVAPTGWTPNGGAGITVASGVSFGGMAGAVITSGAPDWSRAVSNAISMTSGTSHAVTVWLRAGTSGRARLEVFGTGVNLIVSGPVGALAAAFQSGGTVGPISQVHLGGGVWRVRFRITPSVSVANATFGIGPGVAGGGQTVIAYAAQVEPGPAATSYIPTITAAANRAADAPTLALGGWFRPTEGMIRLDLKPFATTAQTLLSVINTGGSPLMALSCDSAGLMGLSAPGITLSAATPLVAGPSQSVTVSWGAGGSRLQVGASSVSGPTFALSGATGLRFGPANSIIQSLFIWDRAL